MDSGSPQSSRRPSLSLSQLEAPLTLAGQSTTLEQIHASNSAATGLTSFHLGSPPPAAPTPITFNKLYSKVKSVAAGVREAVRDAVVIGPVGRLRSGTNDSRESLETYSIGSSSNRASPTASNFQIRSRYNNPNRLSLSNVSIMTKGSTGSVDAGSPSALRKVNILSPGPKSAPSPSLAQVTVFRDGGADNSGGEGSFTGVARKTNNGVGASHSPSPGSEQMSFNKYSVLQDQAESSEDIRLEADNTGEEIILGNNIDDAIQGNSGVVGGVGGGNAPSNGDFKRKNVVPDLSHPSSSNRPLNQNLSLSSTSIATRSSSIPQPPVVQSHPTGNSLLNQSKRKSSIGALSNTKSMRKRPKSVKRTSEILLPGFTYNSESDTDDDEEDDNTSSPADTSSAGAKTSLDRNRMKSKSNRSAIGSIPVVGGVRALAGWFGVGGTVSENQSSDRGGGTTLPSSGGNIEAVELALQQLRKGTLNKEFWMKDENCKDCFACWKTFNAFRRKHHCRLCGQIFCSKCTTTISGERFGYNGSMKVCLRCQDYVKEYRDESDLEHTNLQSLSIPEHPASHTAGTVPGADSGFNPAFSMPAAHRPATTPLMAIPATRTTAGSNPNRRSAILEINSDKPSPPRPSSSRSMKASIISSRPMTAASFKHSYQHNHHPHSHHSHYHKHTHTRSMHRWPGHNPNDRAPFHRNPADDVLDSMNTLPAFYTDSIIDPELAPYMSDQDGTDDEQMSIFATIAPRNSDGHSTSLIASPITSAGISQGDRNHTGALIPGAAGTSGKAMSLKNGLGGNAATLDSGNNSSRNLPVKPAKRNSNFLNPLQTRSIPRGHRGLMRHIHSASDPMGSRSNMGSASSRVARTSSTRGPLASSIELNTASLQHVQNLLKQLLRDAGIQEVDKWEQALMPILLKSTDDLNPDIRTGDVIDIRHYIKVKRIPGGKPKDTSYVSGVVFTKNLALKSMPRNINQPRIVIVTFPIEYQRAQQFMSLGPVISQEKEFLQNMVNRIVALKPTLLLVGENISGLALQYLAAANVATAYHVKTSVIHAVARCAQADVFSSVDKLALSHFRIGRCANFDVKTFVHEDIYPNKKKTFMFLSGCAKELGCTIVLRGADMSTLAIIKQITEMMVYVVYNLKLETCLMRDEFVLIPSTPKAPVPVPQLPSAPLTEVKMDLGLEDAGEVTQQEQELPSQNQENEATRTSEDKTLGRVPTPSYYEDMVKKHETKILSASPFVKYSQPYLLMTARELERKLGNLRLLRDRQAVDEKTDTRTIEARDPEKFMDGEGQEEAHALEKFELIQPEMLHGDSKASKGAKEILRAIMDVEYDKALHVYNTQKKQWENYLAQYDDLFDPYAHQNIVILYTMVCTVTTVPCEGPEIRRLVFYDQGNDWIFGKSDCTLGQYIEYLCDTANNTCSTAVCEKKMFDHHRSYVHGQARVSVLVNDKIASPNPGMKNTILMWSYCKICPNTNTPAIPMSESTWKYSFAKYLELAFWSSELKLRGGVCPHDLSRDHVRCFGYHGMTVVFQHDPIELLEIFVPRTRIAYKPELDLKVKNDQYTIYEEKINRFMGSVRSRLASIKVETVAPEKQEACRAEVERLLAKLEEEQAWLIAKLREKYTKSKYYEIIPMNRAMRAMQEKILDWDMEFTAFDNSFFPSEKDIKRLAALQLKKLFLEPTNPDLPHEETTPSPEKDEKSKQASIDGTSTPVDNGQPIDLLSQATQDALAAVMEEDATADEFPEKYPEQIAKDPESDLTITGALTETPGVDLEMRQLGVEPSIEDQNLTEELLKPEQEQISPEPIPSSNDQISTIPIQVEEATPPQDSNPLATSETIIDNKQRSRSQSQHASKLSEGKITVASSPTPPSSTGGGPRRKGSVPMPFGRTSSIPSGIPRKLSETSALPIPNPRKSSDSGLSSGSSGPRPPHAITVPIKKTSEVLKGTSKSFDKPKAEKKLSDRLRLSQLSSKKSSRDKDSVIPRSVPNKLQRRDHKVSNLAKHFEQLTREFETERANQRKQLAAKRTKVYPVASTKPIVEVYKNVRDAVESEDDYPAAPLEPLPVVPPVPEQPTIVAEENTDEGTVTDSADTANLLDPNPPAEETHGEEPVPPTSQPHSDAEESDIELSMHSDHESNSLPSITDVLPPTPDVPDSDLKELPRHEKSSLMNILSKFWAERSASGWVQLDYPLAPTEHIFADSDVIVREDEPSSLIAFTLNSSDYIAKLQNLNYESSSYASMSSSQNQIGEHADLERSLLKTTGTHIKYQFSEGSAKMYCKVFFAEQFDALRKNCAVGDRFAESLSRCGKWDSKGGKSKSVFLKTLDDRIVMKALQPVETTAFLKFAPAYFRFMSEAFFHELPTVIAKMLGFYQIFIKNPATGTEIKWDVLVMENLFYDRKMTKVFDLKGSMRNRYAQATGDSGEVLLDENMVEFIYESPLFVREHAKKLLRASLWNDTLFLAKQNVMDYSLMIGIDEVKKELVVGIIDCIRTFTWDKKLESWVKDLTGGGRNIRPTVTSPKEYKHRFREAMERYILEAPSCWHLFRMSWMSPVQVRLGTNNSQARDLPANNDGSTITANSALANTSVSIPSAVATAGSVPAQVMSPVQENGEGRFSEVVRLEGVPVMGS